jgi:hypothetical protein
MNELLCRLDSADRGAKPSCEGTSVKVAYETPDNESYCTLRAAECEQKAQTATSPEIKAAFLEMKRRWLLSADQVRTEPAVA